MIVIVVDVGFGWVSCLVEVVVLVVELFVIVVDFWCYCELDGLGMVCGNIKVLVKLVVGLKFLMKMKLFGLLYCIISWVIVFKLNELVEWSYLLGYWWRWEFELLLLILICVIEIFDYYVVGVIKNGLKFYEMMGFVKFNVVGIEVMLVKLSD